MRALTNCWCGAYKSQALVTKQVPDRLKVREPFHLSLEYGCINQPHLSQPTQAGAVTTASGSGGKLMGAGRIRRACNPAYWVIKGGVESCPVQECAPFILKYE